MDPAEDALDGEWPLNGPFNFDRWRDMIERCARCALCLLRTRVHLCVIKQPESSHDLLSSCHLARAQCTLNIPC